MDKEDIEAQISFITSRVDDLYILISTYGEINTESLEVMRHVIDAIKELNLARCKLMLLGNKKPYKKRKTKG